MTRRDLRTAETEWRNTRHSPRPAIIQRKVARRPLWRRLLGM